MSRCEPPNASNLIQGWFWLKDNEGKYTAAEWYDGCWSLPGAEDVAHPREMQEWGFTVIEEIPEPVE